MTQKTTIPPNFISKDSTKITPEMLPLITLSQADIDAIIAQTPGGVANIQDIYGLTPLQNGMLKEGDPYIFVRRLRFDDRTSLERYANAMQKVIDRHDILHTAIFWNGLIEPAQVVLRHVPSILIEIDVNESDKLVLEQLSQKFNPRYYHLDLKMPPLLRLIAAPELEGSWVAVQLMHHIIIDYSALEKVQEEIQTIMNRKIEMLPMVTQFRNLVAETRQEISLAEYSQFFTEMLGDIDEPTLPFGLNDVDQVGSDINEAYLMLPRTLNDQLRLCARNLQVSLASICHLAWAQVVAKASGREVVVFGTVLHSSLKGGKGNNTMMGPKINTLPFRLNIDDKCVETSVRDAHARLSALLAHEHAPFELAQRCSDVLLGLPLFSALLNYCQKQNAEEVNKLLPGVSFLDHVRQTNYPLTLSVDDNDSSLCLSVQVVSSLSATRISAYMQQSLESLVNALVDTPQQPIQRLKVMPPEERKLLLHGWNLTTMTNSPVCCFHQLFEAQVECNGHAVAVECKAQSLSYSELNVQANRLAHYLMAHGAIPGDRIALCVERSATMIISILGILKAGCTYVPLDPVYTSLRLTNILLDADPKFLLADISGREALEDHQIQVIDLEKPLRPDLPINNPDTTKLSITAAHLAYIIYTSGSTGTPKGVMVEHQQYVRLLNSTHTKFDFNAQDKWCLFHSISVSICVWEIWTALYYGSQLLIPSYDIIHSTDEFHNWICSNNITVLNQSPSAFKMLMRIKNDSWRNDRLRYIILCGEALDPSIVKEWYDKYEKSGTVLVNTYGNSEAPHAFFYRFKMAKNFNLIGRPLQDIYVYLLDSQAQPALIGAEGEIYISGAVVARGYLNRPELTAERFLLDPFTNDPTVRMYRTGDLARYQLSGDLIYLGRADQQVKIRGFRIEIGEIEARLIEHPQVHEAAVRSYGKGLDACLVAYLVATSDEALVQNLRTYLSALLPSYMVPAAFVCLPSFPLTRSGKLNRRELPAPNDEAFARQKYEAPQGEMEEKLAHTWHKLLKIDRIGRRDNFFALGGHSLLAVQLLINLRQIGLDTTIREVFNAPTLAELASSLTRYKAVTIPPSLIRKESTEITPEMLPLITLSQADIDAIISQTPGGVSNIQDIYGLTLLQSGMLYHHLMVKEGDPYLIVRRIRFIDRTSLERYADALQRIVERHDILRTAIFWDGLSEPAQVVSRQVPSILTQIILDESDKPILEQLNQEYSLQRYRLDLTQAPLFRLLAASESEGSWVALQFEHHSIVDYSTLEKLLEEIHAILNGKIEILPNITPFRHYVALARQQTKPTDHTQFFTEMLGDIDEPTLLFGLSEVGQNGAEISEAYLKLSQTLNDQLRAHARNLQVSLASMCHLAWAQVLAKATGREAVVFGTVLLGGFQIGGTNSVIVGPMINTLPIRCDIDERSVETVVRDAHSRLSMLLAHEYASLVLAQRCSGVPAGLPLFNSLLNYRHNQKTEEFKTSLPGVNFLENVWQTTYPLAMSVDDNESSLSLLLQVISPISATRINAYVQQCLESLVNALAYSPKQPVQTLRVMSPEERNLILHKWNQTTVTNLPICCLHQLFEAQAECDGEAIAVEFSGQILSYSELNEQTNRLAHHLIAQGVKPDDRIALCIERSIAMIVAILGILKAGCAYVPLDPVYSSKRLTNILLDADPVFLLADCTGRNVLGKHQIPGIDLEKVLLFDLAISNLNGTELGLTPAHLAYTIYTSGSTGTPKGVMVEHRQVVRLFKAMQSKFDFNKQDNWSLFHSISFDFSISEMWGALSFGSQVSITSYDIVHSMDEFHDWICINGITVLNQTTAALQLLIRAKNNSLQCDRLRYVIFGGESLDPIIAKQWYKKYERSATILVHVFGTTETTVFATFQQLETSEKSHSIGRPIPDYKVYLLDSHGAPVLLGAEGEMYIGGFGVARGYLNRPDLTRERFLSDPFNNDPTARMYRTGDLARYLQSAI